MLGHRECLNDISTVRDFEKGRRVPIRNNLEAMRLVLEVAGVILLTRDGKAAGIEIVPV